MTLPIHALERDLLDRLRAANRLVLTAPTGSGKTTQVPQMLLRAGLFSGRILVSQPRRLAARLVARRVAGELGSPLGEVVGYRTRHENRSGPATRICFLTEGLLLRLLRNPRDLDAVGAIVLDEFHERTLAADLSLALVRRLQETARPDLRLIVMSATLEAGRVAAYLDCPALQVESREHAIEIAYLPHSSAEPCWDLAAAALREILRAGAPGDVLVFQPGAYEIRKTLDACRAVATRGGEKVALLPLHGEMAADEQDAALAPRTERRVIVSTNVAQTSITVEGIRHVIDSGLARIHRFDPLRGINALRVEAISRAAADQRAGRAGRTAPGACRRLWTRRQHEQREAHDLPEVRRLDLAEPLLLLHDLGIERPGEFTWLEPPEAERIAQAHSLLAGLGALDAAGVVTQTGRRMAAVPAHPRLSRLLVEAARRGGLARACLWTAMIGERDILERRRARDFVRPGVDEGRSDFESLEHAFEAACAARFDVDACRAIGVHAGACREVDQARRLYERACRDAGLVEGAQGDPDALLEALLVAFPDHLAAQRPGGERGYTLIGDRPAVLDETSVVRGAPLVVAVEIRERETGKSRGVELGLATRVEPAWLLDLCPARVVSAQETVWNESAQAVERHDRLTFEGLTIDATVRPEPDLERAAALLAERIGAGRLKLERWDERVEQWIARARCVSEWFQENKIPAYDDADFRAIRLVLCSGATRASQVRERPCLDAVRGALTREQQQFVERMAPERIDLPGGRRMPVEYAPGAPPRGRARIQDLYGLTQTPRVAGGRRPVLLEILAPNSRPVQTTDDLAGFWEKLYPEVKKELKRRYPKHEWR